MNAIDTLARRMGLVWAYRDGAGRDQCAPPESRLAVLRALGLDVATEAQASEALATLPADADWEVLEPGTTPEFGAAWCLRLEDGSEQAGSATTRPLPLPIGRHRLDTAKGSKTLLVAPQRLPVPRPAWGLTAPLYGLWEGTRSGVGCYTMLGRLAADLGNAGAGFLGVNPIHAGFDDAMNFSPYAPSHRRRWSVLHIDAGAAHKGCSALVDYADAMRTQQAALRARYACFTNDQEQGFGDWRTDQGESLEDFVTHQALSEQHGPYWHDWPCALRDPRSDESRRFAAAQPDALRFHAWCQWQAERQLGAARDAARGMTHGLYLDLAVGTHPAGAETWAEQELFARGVSLGAPPDLLAPNGQRWNLAPMDPRALAADGFAALAQTLRQQLRFARLLRIDHILGFERAYWVPDCGAPGIYMQMPREALLAVVRIEAALAGATIIGEDLGTVPDGLRARLAASGILGCTVAMFERRADADMAFRSAASYPVNALTSFSTHDLPTWAGWRAGRDLDWRAQLGEMTPQAAEAARAIRCAEVAAFDATAGTSGCDPVALHGFLGRTPAPLVAFQAEDICGAREQPNLPGTIHEHPNWRRRLPLSCAALASSPALHASAAAFAGTTDPQEAEP